MMAWWRRHLVYWFGVTYVPVRLDDGRVTRVACPSDLAVHGWRVWRWTR